MKDARHVGPNSYRLCFRSLFDPGRGYAFPCDGNGWVDLDGLSESARNNYLYARAMIGRELAAPAVEPADLRGDGPNLPATDPPVRKGAAGRGRARS